MLKRALAAVVCAALILPSPAAAAEIVPALAAPEETIQAPTATPMDLSTISAVTLGSFSASPAQVSLEPLVPAAAVAAAQARPAAAAAAVSARAEVSFAAGAAASPASAEAVLGETFDRARSPREGGADAVSAVASRAAVLAAFVPGAAAAKVMPMPAAHAASAAPVVVHTAVAPAAAAAAYAPFIGFAAAIGAMAATWVLGRRWIRAGDSTGVRIAKMAALFVGASAASSAGRWAVQAGLTALYAASPGIAWGPMILTIGAVGAAVWGLKQTPWGKSYSRQNREYWDRRAWLAAHPIEAHAQLEAAAWAQYRSQLFDDKTERKPFSARMKDWWKSRGSKETAPAPDSSPAPAAAPAAAETAQAPPAAPPPGPSRRALFSKAMGSDKKEAAQIIKDAGMPPDVEAAALAELDKLLRTSPHDTNYNNYYSYIEWLLEVPWNVRTQDKIDLAEARRLLDADNFGLEKVKEQVIEYLAVRKKTGGLKGKILCFAGPPGVGKTSIADDIAKAMGRKFVRVALGGVSDETKIRGFRRTYVSSQPGIIVKKMKEAGSMNPVMLLDEVDKVGTDGHRGNPMDALLELLDPSQNKTFEDHYLEQPIDMSEALFIVTVNDLSKLSGPLRDRLEIIEFSSYTTDEKIQIAQRHVLPEMRRDNGVPADEAKLSDAAARRLIEGYTQEAGVRRLKQVADKLMRSVSARTETAAQPVPAEIAESDLETYLGPAPFGTSRTVDNGVGRATALYYSAVGGGTSNVVATASVGTGNFILREQMLKMTKDSAANVMGYLRSIAPKLGIDPRLFGRIDINLQFSPAQDIDGPSAGITMALAVASRLTGRPVKKGVAMTGELTLDGRVLPIGGLKEKALGALRDGYHTVLYPALNEPDARQIPPEVRAKLTLIPVERMDQVFERALEKDVAEPLDIPADGPPASPMSGVTGMAGGLVLAATLAAPSAFASGGRVALAARAVPQAGVSNAFGFTMLFLTIFALLWLTRWVHGSYGFQAYLSKRLFITQNDARWRDVPDDVKTRVHYRGYRWADASRAGRVNSFKGLLLALVNRHPVLDSPRALRE